MWVYLVFIHVCKVKADVFNNHQYNIIDGASCNVYLCLQNGQSPLMVELSRGHFEVVKLLLDKGAEVNYQDMVSYS